MTDFNIYSMYYTLLLPTQHALPPPLSLAWHEALLPPEAPPRRQHSVSFPPWRRPASHAFQGFAVLRGRLSGSAAIVRLPSLRLIL